MKPRASVVVVAALCLTAGCTAPVPSAVEPSPLVSSPPSAVPGFPVVLPTHTLTGSMPAALITGKLAFKDGCVTISDQTGAYEAVWPSGFSARRTDDIVLIVAPTGKVFGTGGQISLGGGVFEGASASHVRDNSINLLPMCDHEPFWLVADVSDP